MSHGHPRRSIAGTLRGALTVSTNGFDGACPLDVTDAVTVTAQVLMSASVALGSANRLAPSAPRTWNKVPLVLVRPPTDTLALPLMARASTPVAALYVQATAAPVA